MTDPGSSMSLTAILILTGVVLILMGGWLGVIFRVGASARRQDTRPGDEDPAHARQPQASRLP